MAADQAFQFFFADSEDVYFTRNLLKLDFEQYLYRKLRQNGLEAVYFFDEITQNEVKISCQTQDDGELYKKNAPFMSKTKFEETGFGERYHFEARQNWQNAWATIKKLVKDAHEDHFAFVFPLNMFARLLGDRSTEVEMKDNLLKNRCKNGSVFLLYENPEQEGKLPKLPSIVLADEEQSAINEDGKSPYLFDRVNTVRECGICRRTDPEQLSRLARKVYLHYSKCMNQEKADHYFDRWMEENPDGQNMQRRIRNKKDLYDRLLQEKMFTDFEMKYIKGNM